MLIISFCADDFVDRFVMEPNAVLEKWLPNKPNHHDLGVNQIDIIIGRPVLVLYQVLILFDKIVADKNYNYSVNKSHMANRI